MNILMMVSWYTPKGYDKLEAGVFHYEQSMDLMQYCNMAIYFPFDQNLEEALSAGEEWGLQTYRSRYAPRKFLQNKKNMKAATEQIMKEFKPDIIHAHCGSAAGYYAVEFAKKYKIPLVITEHSPIEISHVDKRGIPHYFGKKAYGYSSANVCVSEDSKNKLSRIFPEDNFEVIYNGIILPEYNDTAKQYYKEGYINIGIVAILYDLEIKGLKYLLGAMKILKESGQKFYLHHIGGGEFLEHFQRMAVELGVDDVVEFHGRCDRKQLYEIVNEMDFFCSSSLMECSGVSVQESMLLGKPILGTNSGGVDSLVPENCGHIVEKANAKALAEGALFMREHLADYNTEEIRTYALSSFEINHISQRYVELYERVLKNKK